MKTQTQLIVNSSVVNVGEESPSIPNPNKNLKTSQYEVGSEDSSIKGTEELKDDDMLGDKDICVCIKIGYEMLFDSKSPNKNPPWTLYKSDPMEDGTPLSSDKHKERLLAELFNPDANAGLHPDPEDLLVTFLGEYVVYKCVRFWNSRSGDQHLRNFFIFGQINKGYACNKMFYDLLSCITSYGKRHAASMLRRKKLAKTSLRDALSARAIKKALKIVRNIHERVNDYIPKASGGSLLHCCVENTPFHFFDGRKTAYLIAYTLHSNLVLMHESNNGGLNTRLLS